MSFVTYLPTERLKPYIKHFIISGSNASQTYKVLPGTSLVIGFQYSGQLSYIDTQEIIPLSTAGITGLMNCYRVFKNTENTQTLLVVFNETGAASFLKLPVNELFNKSISLDNFFSKKQLCDTEEKLSEASNNLQRIAVVEQFLINQLQYYKQDKLVEAAVANIYYQKGNIRIADLASQLNISQSPLEKRFRKIVGASPKKFSSIVRMKNVMHNLLENDYRETVFMAGYHDQAHLINDFKSMTGNTPEQYIKSLNK